MHNVEFYYDIVCPYACMAFRGLDGADAWTKSAGVEIHLKPILLGGLLRELAGPVDPNLAMPAARRELGRIDIQRSARLQGLELNSPPQHPRRTVAAMRLLTAAPANKRMALTRALFDAYWIEGRDVASAQVLRSVAEQVGVSFEEVAQPANKLALREATTAAQAKGVFGVPTFVHADGLVWGQDRVHLLRRALGGPAADPALCHPLGGLAPTAAAGTRVAFFHDFSSPFSYLAATQIERVVARRGAQLDYTPILLGALFRELGTANVPLAGMSAAKQAYVRRDLDQWAQAWGVDFVFPKHFPIRSVLPLRVALAEPATTGAIYRAVWGQQRRIDEPESLGAVLQESGFDAEALIAAAQTSQVKQALRDSTERASNLGLCGVPSFEVLAPGRPSVTIWGQDRLHMLDAVLRGWQPSP